MDWLEQLRKEIRRVTDGVILAPDLVRLQEVDLASKLLFEILRQFDPDTKMNLEIDPLFHTAVSVVFTTVAVSITDMEEFVLAIKRADSFEIAALNDGNLEIVCDFNNCYVPIGKIK